MLRVDAPALHPGPEPRIVEFSAPHRADATQHLPLAVREVAPQPVLEERGDGPREAHRDVPGEGGASLRGGREEVRDLVVVEARDHGRSYHTDRDACLRELPDRCQPPDGPGRSRLHDAPEVVVQRRQGDRDGRGPVSGELRQQVYVPDNEVVFGDHDYGVAETREDFEAAARDPELPLHGLVGIGYPAHRENLRLPPRRGQLPAQQPRRVFLHEHLALEVQPGREAKVFVRGAGITVNAAMRASSVRVDARLETDVRARVRGDDGAGVVAQVDGLGAVLVAGFGGVGRELELLEAVLRVGGGSPAGDAPRSLALPHRRILPAAGRLATVFSPPGGPSASRSGRILGWSSSGPGDLGRRPRGGSVRMDPLREMCAAGPGPRLASLSGMGLPW